MWFGWRQNIPAQCLRHRELKNQIEQLTIRLNRVDGAPARSYFSRRRFVKWEWP